MNKKMRVLLLLSFLFILVLGAAYTYSKYYTEVSGVASADVAEWDIIVNNCKIDRPNESDATCFEQIDNGDGTFTLKKNFNISDMTYSNSDLENVAENKLSPGSSGTFKVVIEPGETQVSIKYTMDVSLLYDNSSIALYRSDPNSNNKIPMEEDGFVDYMYYTDSGFTYKDSNGIVKSAERLEFIIYVEWVNDENNNEADTIIGTSGTAPVLEIPVNILFEQYLG